MLDGGLDPVRVLSATGVEATVIQAVLRKAEEIRVERTKAQTEGLATLVGGHVARHVVRILNRMRRSH